MHQNAVLYGNGLRNTNIIHVSAYLYLFSLLAILQVFYFCIKVRKFISEEIGSTSDNTNNDNNSDIKYVNQKIFHI